VTKALLMFDDHYKWVMQDYHCNQVAGGEVLDNLNQLDLEEQEGEVEAFMDDDLNNLNGIIIDDDLGNDRFASPSSSDVEVFDTTCFNSIVDLHTT